MRIIDHNGSGGTWGVSMFRPNNDGLEFDQWKSSNCIVTLVNPEVWRTDGDWHETGTPENADKSIATKSIGELLKTNLGFEYRVNQHLGCGGQSNVYLATRTSDQEVVAFKIATRGGESIENQLLERESRTLSRLDHPHIVKVLESGRTHDGQNYAALQAITGQTLEEILHIKYRLSPISAIAICLQIADAMDHAHSRGVIHGDLKPGNIMVAEANGFEHVYVLDFGIAYMPKELSPRSDEFTFGSLCYMSPEQLFDGEISERSDVFQLGLILYECIFGCLPFQQDRDSAIEYRQAGCTLWEAQKRRETALASQWKDFFTRVLAKNPSVRFANMRAVAKELRKLASTILPASGFCDAA